MVEYNVVVKDKEGNRIGELSDWLNISYEKRLNYYGQASISFPITQPFLDSLIALRKYEVDIYRNNTIVWSGEQGHRQGGLRYNSANIITITCFDYFELLNYMFTDEAQIYTQVDAGAIAWDLINTFQQKVYGNLGFTLGTIEPTMLRDRKYYSDNIMELIVRLTEVINGFDFEITDSKVFNVYARKGVDRSVGMVFEYGTNIREVKNITSDFSNPVTQAVVLGDRLDDIQERIEVINESAASSYGLRQGRENAHNVTEMDTFTEKGQELLRRRKQPLLNISFTQMPNTRPAFGSIALGDTIRVKIQEGIYNINTKFRVYGWSVRVDQKGDEIIDYFVSIQS